MKTRYVFAAVALAAASGAALAHPGHESASFFTGFTHPLGGLDHLLAMLAVGLYAARQPGATPIATSTTSRAAMSAPAPRARS